MKIVKEKSTLTNFDYASNLEWIEFNSLGAYSSSTVYGLNSRRYHGLFNVPERSNGKKINLVSKFEETLLIGEQSFEFSTNQYLNAIYPPGYEYLEKFSIDPFPKFTFVIGNRKLEKTVILLHDNNLLMVRYELKNNGLPIRLIIKPIIGARYTHELVTNVQGINLDSYMEHNVVKIAPRADIPELKIYYSDGEYVPAPLWYHNYFYTKDKAQNNTEDLLNPGFFIRQLKAYDTLDLFMYIDRWANFNFEELYRKEKEYRSSINPRFKKLPAFVQDISKKLETIPVTTNTFSRHFHFNFFGTKYNSPESLLPLLGLLMVKHDQTIMNQVIKNLVKRIDNGILYINDGDNRTNEYPENSLLLINFAYYVYKLYKNKEFLESEIFEPFVEIIEKYRKGTNLNIYMDKDGLLFCGDKNTNTSFIQLKSKDNTFLRYGKLLEVNAYWINALNVMLFFSEILDKKRLVKKFGKLKDLAVNSFLNEFWDKKNNRFYDFIRNDIKDQTFRINQIIPLAVPFRILDINRGILLMQSINNELLTPFGLRSLSEKDEEFNCNNNSDGNGIFKGAVLPWMITDYFAASIRYRQEDMKILLDKFKNILNNFETLYIEDCLGYISEVVQGDEFFHGGGQVINLLNLTEILRASMYLQMVEKKINSDKQ